MKKTLRRVLSLVLIVSLLLVSNLYPLSNLLFLDKHTFAYNQLLKSLYTKTQKCVDNNTSLCYCRTNKLKEVVL